MMKKTVVPTMLLAAAWLAWAGVPASAADKVFPAATTITAARSLSATSINSGESITATFTLTNNVAQTLNGFFYSDNLPDNAVVATTSVKVNGTTLSAAAYQYGASSAGAIYTGSTTHTWMVQTPANYGTANTINASGGSVQIVYTIQLTGSGTVPLEGYAWAGKLGVETGAATNAVFGYCDPVNIQVTFTGWSDNFDDGNYTANPVWTVGEGTWSVSSGQLENTATGRTSIYGGLASWTDITYTSSVTPVTSTDVFVLFRVQNASNYLLFTLMGTAGKGALYAVQNGAYSSKLADGNGAVTFSANTTYIMKVELTGTTIKIYANNTLVLNTTNALWSNGAVGFGSNAAQGRFDNVQVTTPSGLKPAVAAHQSNGVQLAIYPNPANSLTPLYVDCPDAIDRAEILDLSGQRLGSCVLESAPAAGALRRLVWDRTDGHGQALPAGQYLVRFDLGGQVVTRNLLIVQ